MLEAKESSIKARSYHGKKAREKTEQVSTKSWSNILTMGTLTLIVTMASTEVLSLDNLLQHRAKTKSQSSFILGSRNFYEINESIGNISRGDKQYDVQEPPDEVQDL